MTEPTSLAEFYESEYSARSRVPDYARYFQRWLEESARTRERLIFRWSVRYGTGAHETLDLFPASPRSDRLLVFIHGGYWRSFDKRDFSWIAQPFVRAGISAALINYALCPAVTIADIAEQCRRALAWLYRNAQEHGSTCMIVTGHSAGGHLTGMMFATDWGAYDVPETAFGGGVSISGLFDLDPLRYTQMNSDLRLDVESARAVSPVFMQPRISAPLVVIVGALESSEFQRQSRIICQAWPGNCAGPLVLPDCHHFNILDVFTDLSHPLWRGLL